MVVAANLSLQKCRLGTSSITEELPEKLHKFIQLTCRMLGSDIVTSIIVSKPGSHDERIWIGCDLDIHVAVIALEERVVDGLMFLDQIVLEVERLRLALHDHEIYLDCLVEHILLPDRSCSKVLRDTITQIFRLPNIENDIFGIIKKVDSWFGRDSCEIIKVECHCGMYSNVGEKCERKKRGLTSHSKRKYTWTSPHIATTTALHIIRQMESHTCLLIMLLLSLPFPHCIFFELLHVSFFYFPSIASWMSSSSVRC